MQTWRYTLRPLSAFATPLMGDTLFGQICWTIRHCYGESRLKELLFSYTAGTPFCVVSNGFPFGYLPRPHLPLFSMSPSERVGAGTRKQSKRKQWMPILEYHQPVTEWLAFCKGSDELRKADNNESVWQKHEGRMQNSINRLTGTTGEGGFAPYAVEQHWYHPNALLHLYVQIDTACFSISELEATMARIGSAGYGKDASTGRGQFSIQEQVQIELPQQDGSNGWMVLAPCAPQQLGFNPEKSYWQPFTRFGRHGSIAAIGGQPFKNPVLLAGAGSVFTPAEYSQNKFIGQGLGGNGELSKTIWGTVHQGYAPVVGLNLHAANKRIAESCLSETV
jgi:CRISPR-associated protein Csm4